MVAAPRILLSGDVLGRFNQLFKRVASVNKSAGLSVVYLSGMHSASVQQFGTYSQDDVDSLRAFSEEHGIVDLFLANEWPKGVTNRAAASEVTSGMSDSSTGNSTISDLVSEIKPRYHIAGTVGVYYDREPYVNVGAVHMTRFLALGSVGNKNKQKFLRALSPTPASTMSPAEICTKLPKTTLSPYSFSENASCTDQAIKRSGDSSSDTQYWRYDDSRKRPKHGNGDGERLCFKFISSGLCPRGEMCHFHHDADAREQSIRGVCFDFLNEGKCERGPVCKFKHSL